MFKKILGWLQIAFLPTTVSFTPVEQPMKIEFIVNLKAAKLIGFTMPPEMLARATRIIR